MALHINISLQLKWKSTSQTNITKYVIGSFNLLPMNSIMKSWQWTEFQHDNAATYTTRNAISQCSCIMTYAELEMLQNMNKKYMLTISQTFLHKTQCINSTAKFPTALTEKTHGLLTSKCFMKALHDCSGSHWQHNQHSNIQTVSKLTQPDVGYQSTPD